MFLLSFLLLVTSLPLYNRVAAATNCPAPASYNDEAKEYIDYYKIPLKSSNGKPLSEKYLLNQAGIGERVIVYGCPSDVNDNDYDLGQYRYLGWDAEGNLYRNWRFRSDSRATLHVAKNWVKSPWDTATGRSKEIRQTILSQNQDAASWLERIVDPYKESPTFLQSYNKRTGKGWTGDTLLDYAIIQQKPTQFSPGVVQMWNIWAPDGSWWYEMFTIPAEPLTPPPSKPDLIISDLIAPADAWVGDSVPIKITTKNQGKTNTGAFTIGIVGTSIKSEVISNVPPGQIKTVTVNVSSSTKGIKTFTAKTDFGEAVAESNENNNTKDFKIVFNNKNEPTTPIAIISHLEGDHRTEPEITIKPSVDPKLDDKLSYSPGKEAITVREWKYKNPSGTTIQKKPVAKDFVLEGKYLVELRVTNSAKKVSEWAQLTINVGEKATPRPSTTPEPTPTPRPELKAAIRFVPDKIIAGETSSLYNSSNGFDYFEWTFSDNLNSVLTDKSQYEYYNKTFTEGGTYRARIKVSDSSGSATAEATLTVIDPKPMAVVSGATKVIEGRPFPVPYHLNNSYTPLADRGVTIDHSKDEKRYKRVGDTAYINGFPTTNNLAIGEYILEGKVYDTTGRVSDWANLIVEVVPDIPPTVEVISPAETYRENSFMLYIDAESPDMDILQHLLLEERYDHNGNGNFEEEAWTTIYNGAYKTTHPVQYTTVGKRQYRATVTEDYGKKGISPLAETDVLNYAPTVNFNVFGMTQQPGQGEDSGPPVTNYSSQSIFRSWTFKRPYVGGNADKIAWKADANTISTKNAQMVNFDLKYPNAGNGPNGRNKYNLASDLVAKPRWQINTSDYDNKRIVYNGIFNNNRMYLGIVVEFQNPETWYTETKLVYEERDAVTGNLLRPRFELAGMNDAYRNVGLFGDERFYATKVLDQNRFDMDVYNNKGTKVDNYSFDISGTDGRWISGSLIDLMPDHKSAIISISLVDSYYEEVRYYKYNFESRSVEWVATGPKIDRYLIGQFTYTTKMTVAQNGIIYLSAKALSKIFPNGSRIDSPVPQGQAEGSAVSVSDDGNYVYRIQYGHRVDDDESRNYLTVYNANDMSIVTQYFNLPDYYFNYGDSSSYHSPTIRSDGTVILLDGGYVFFFSKTGSFLFKTFINTASVNFHPGLLPNGQLFSPAYTYSSTDYYRYSLQNIDTMSNIVTEPVPVKERPNMTGIGRNTVTPILPNGSVFLFQSKQFPFFVIPFVSESGNANLQDIDANTVGIFDDNWGGLLYDAGSNMKNYSFEFNTSVNDVKNERVIGAAFQIQNEKNMYATEWSKDTISLFKVVNGVKTLLQSKPMARSAFNTYPVKIESINGVQSVYVNYSKVLEVTDGTYTRGFAGIMSIGQSNTYFSNVKKTNYGDTYTQPTYDTVLVNDPISYEKIFNDIDKDPMGAEEWSYSHNPNFFENPEGLSVHSGKTYGSTINALEKAGVYEITFRAKDNPSLSAYSKWSEPVKKLLYVHRRPVAQPDVRLTGKVFAEGEALDYETFDKSFDPDIAHILAEKVFRTRWGDETKWTTGKRQYYNRPGVELIVQEQVKDIHGAWSYWAQTEVYKEGNPPVNQTKPVMTITAPAGTTAAAPTVLIKEPTIRWTYYDRENDPQESYRLTFTYVDTNELILSLEHEGNALTYPMLEGTIQQGRVVKVQGQVYSTGVWSDLSNIRYFVLDLPPQTFLLSYNGPDADNPVYTNSNRPQLRVFTVDPENHPITAIDYEVYKASSGAMVVDTNSATAAANYTPPALAEGLHYWKARANDSYLWGPYSSNGFFFVDTVKPADVNEQLTVEPTSVTVTFNAFNDAEPSSGHATRTFYLQKVNADGSVTNIDLNGDGTTEYSIPLALNKLSYRVTGLLAGQEYRLTVLDYDIAGNEGHYAYIHFVTNRPPTGDFDWSPKPVYEGDTVLFKSIVDDADKNILDVSYEITNPSGVKNNYSYVMNSPYPDTGPSIRMVAVGTWTVKMTVSDRIADPVVITKTVQVSPLTVVGIVKHTDQWEQHRKDYNKKKSGNAESPRTSSVFWAGEKFMLEANTTPTGTATKAERVEVKMKTFDAKLKALNTTQIKWTGEMWETSFEKFKNGTLAFIFTAYYSNGTVKTDTVNVEILDNIYDFFRFHRAQ